MTMENEASNIGVNAAFKPSEIIGIVSATLLKQSEE